MSMLPRLKPRCFYDLVIEVAIVRPGPIQGGMVHPYLRRRSRRRAGRLPQREVRQALERTLGVPIFQEQVMQLAILAADFTPGEADALRRAMAAWKRKGGLGPFHERWSAAWWPRAMRQTMPSASSSRSRASANTASRKATPPALRCWSTSAPG
jgi:DNA polymerase III alpha subunit